ncbi:MAG TPA: hypothetical protein VFF53_08160 [Geobacteraceae bacterium]|nr:hypothetical protein [Geobacteraceae bacterium]
MLHIVQVVLSGSAETPKAYCDEGAARAAFVDCAKKYWAQSYAAYCERSGLDSDCFSSAQSFVATFDLADRSRIHYWPVTPEDGVAGGTSSLLPGLELLKERSERIKRLVQEVEQASVAVREELTGLLETIADLTGDATVESARPDGEPDTPGRLAAAERSSSPTPEPSGDMYNTREWKEYVESIKNMCGGTRSEFHLFTRHDWRQAVYSEETPFEYWEWVAATIDHHIEKAQQAGYSVVPDPDTPGHYRFKSPDGIVSDIATETEGEAWCRAGLHLEGKGEMQ